MIAFGYRNWTLYIDERLTENLGKFCVDEVTESETQFLLDCSFYTEWYPQHLFDELELDSSQLGTETSLLL